MKCSLSVIADCGDHDNNLIRPPTLHLATVTSFILNISVKSFTSSISDSYI